MSKTDTKISQVLEFIREHPNYTNKKIAEELDINYETVKKSITNLITQGKLIRTDEGLKVLVKKPTISSSYKKEHLKRLVDGLMSEFEISNTLDDKLRIADVVLRIMIRL